VIPGRINLLAKENLTQANQLLYLLLTAGANRDKRQTERRKLLTIPQMIKISIPFLHPFINYLGIG